MRITLKESLDHSATEAYLQSKDWPAEVFSQAVAHHLKQGVAISCPARREVTQGGSAGSATTTGKQITKAP